ncbi:MAG: mechanosensitive ion channel family protein [Paracoccaceae bacterium]
MPNMLRHLAVVLMLVALAAPAWSPNSSTAEEKPALQEQMTPEAVREMVSRLSDADVRDLLLRRLDADAAETAIEEEPAPTVGQTVQAAAIGFWRTVSLAVETVPQLLSSQARAVEGFRARLGQGGGVGILLAIAAAIAAGLAAEFVANRLIAGARAREETTTGAQSFGAVLRILVKRLAIDLCGLLVFFLVGRAVLLAIISEEARPFAAAIVTNVVLMPRFGVAISRFILAPRRANLRLVHADDATARFLHRHQAGLLIWVGFALALVTLNTLSGVRMGETQIGFWLNTVIHVYLIWIIWAARDGLRRIMRGADPDVTPIEARVAHSYPAYGITVVALTWVLTNAIAGLGMGEMLQGAPHFWTMLVLLAAPALDTLVRGLVRALTPPLVGEGEAAAAAYRSAKRSWFRIGRVIVFALVVIVIAKIWGFDYQNLAAAGVGANAAARLLEVLMILAVGYLVWEAISLTINRRLARENAVEAVSPNAAEAGGEGAGAGASRLSTVLPLLHGFLKVAVILMVVLIALGNIGIDITPLLAGAGVFGLAIGFGAQKLVADVVSGAFFLVDDAFRVGEYLDVGGTVGTVEKISVRSMQLRHHKGPVHTIPYGGIDKVTNFSRDWVIMKLKFTVPFDTNPDKVKKIFKKIGADLAADPVFAPDMLEPFKSQGVFDFDDVGMIIRGKFMAKPGKQFTVRKEVFNRVKLAFFENGIEFARREVRVALPASLAADKLTDEDKAKIAAAAAAADHQPG